LTPLPPRTFLTHAPPPLPRTPPQDLTMHMKACGNVYICRCGIRLCSLGALKRHCKQFAHEPESLEPKPENALAILADPSAPAWGVATDALPGPCARTPTGRGQPAPAIHATPAPPPSLRSHPLPLPPHMTRCVACVACAVLLVLTCWCLRLQTWRWWPSSSSMRRRRRRRRWPTTARAWWVPASIRASPWPASRASWVCRGW
jgi:hypothetical protein